MLEDRSHGYWDRLGARLRAADAPSSDDLASYQDYREGFASALAEVVERIGARFPIATSRLKTFDATLAKLRRQPTARLSQVQDIAGCRVIVNDPLEQDRALDELRRIFPAAS